MISPVVQCTGLKDRKGVPIWEGDIVEVWYDDIRYANEIVWIEEKAGFGYRDVEWRRGKKEEFAFTFSEADYYKNVKVIGNRFIAPLELYKELVEECQLEVEIDERTGLRSVIHTGRKRSDGGDIVLYLERDWNTRKTYLTDLEGSKEFRAEVDEKNIFEKMWKLLKEIERRFGG